MRSRYRINDPNSRPRAVKVMALDERSEALVKRLAQDQWDSASFFTTSGLIAVPRSDAQFSMGSWLIDIAGRSKDLVDEISTADVVIMKDGRLAQNRHPTRRSREPWPSCAPGP